MKKLIVLIIALLALCSSVFADGKATEIRRKLAQCENELGVKIQINQTNDYRTVRRQAELMANMTDSQLNWYGSSTGYVVEMKKCTLGGSQRVAEFERLINNARKQGSFLSRHLTGDAVDITPNEKIKSWLLEHGFTVKDETADGTNCWHLQLDGYGIY
jgi:hypothetical protein